MDPYKAESTIHEGGSLRLDRLPFKAGDKVEVVVKRVGRSAKRWPKDYFDKTFGAIGDASFQRHSQGQYEVREPLP